jgi:putative flippase GtrA
VTVTDEFTAVVSVPLPLRERVRVGLRETRNWMQLVRFGFVGTSGFLVNMVTFTLAVTVLHYVAASVLAFLAGVTNNFIWNRRWTFGVDYGHRGFQALRFLAVSICAYAVSLGVLAFLVEVVHLDKVAAQAIANLCGMPVNFLGQKLWSFAT